MAQENQFSVLFVCLGNICRSPTAHGVFDALIEKQALGQHLVCDSCGTGSWHIGEGAHPDTSRVASGRGIDLSSHRARQFATADFDKFDLIVAMDEKNRRDIKRFKRADDARIVLLREFDPYPDEVGVPDPFFGEGDGFVSVFEIVERSCIGLLDSLKEELKLS